MKRVILSIMAICIGICSLWADANTDISQYSEIVYIENAEANPGDEVTLSVQLNNVDPVIGFDFKLYLPSGTTVVTSVDEWEDVVIEADLSGSRTNVSRHTFETALNQEGVLTVLCYSTKNNTFKGNSGEVATIKVKVASDMVPGVYPIIIRDEAISLSSSTPRIDYIQSSLTVLGEPAPDTTHIHDTVYIEVHDTIYVDMVSVNSMNPTMGKVNVLVSAVAEQGFKFLYWSDFDTSNPRIVDLSDGLPKTYTAIFDVDLETNVQNKQSEQGQPKKSIKNGIVYTISPQEKVYTVTGQEVR